jgi:hypothetical protein
MNWGFLKSQSLSEALPVMHWGLREEPELKLPGMNWGFLKNQSMTRTVKLKSTAAWWKVMGPSSLYLASSILRIVSPSAMSNFDFLQYEENAAQYEIR